jgi:hypothetical protein
VKPDRLAHECDSSTSAETSGADSFRVLMSGPPPPAGARPWRPDIDQSEVRRHPTRDCCPSMNGIYATCHGPSQSLTYHRKHCHFSRLLAEVMVDSVSL